MCVEWKAVWERLSVIPIQLVNGMTAFKTACSMHLCQVIKINEKKSMTFLPSMFDRN